MQTITRRNFLKWSVVAAGVLKLSTGKAFAALSENNNAPVIWLQGSGCTGCSISTLTVSNPTTIDDVLLTKVSMKFNNTVMSLSGERAMSALAEAASKYNGQFVLVIEGAIPTGAGGHYCIIGEENGTPVTIMDALIKYGPKAAYVIATGTCASFGGIPAASPNTTSVLPVSSVLINPARPIINLPGCPVHPSITVGAIVDILTATSLTLDSYGRPTKYYESTVHDYCSPPHCFISEGCLGPGCNNVCGSIKWNGKLCTYAGNWCVGCSSPGFPTNPLNSGAYGG
jgi:hydrogenase small subunit